ncbi:hypothetical protein ACFQ0B_57755 [Nonomuraea thailandensis]
MATSVMSTPTRNGVTSVPSPTTAIAVSRQPVTYAATVHAQDTTLMANTPMAMRVRITHVLTASFR